MKQLFIKYFLLCALLISCTVHAQIITTIAGDGTRGFSGDGGPAILASVGVPGGIFVDAKGNIFTTSGISNRVRMIDRNGIINTIAGSGCIYPCYSFSGDGGPATTATMGSLDNVWMNKASNMYLTDGYNNRIRMINSAGIISTVAGTGGTVYNGDGIAATNATIRQPTDAVADDAGNIYIMDWQQLRIRKVNSAGIISTLIGDGVSAYIGDGGPATAARITYQSYCLALDKHGNLYFNDTFCVRMINTAGIVTTIAGTGIAGFSGDGGAATAAMLNSPEGLATDSLDNLYITDQGNQCIRKVNRFGIITTVAGTPKAFGYSGDGGPATAAKFYDPANVFIDCGGNMYIADWWNNYVRVVTYNHVPAMVRGHSGTLAACAGSTAAMDTLLRILDIDTLQGETWTCPTGARHGSVGAGYTISSTGSQLTPSGLTYTPAPGYTGADTLMMVVTDCGLLADTMMVYVDVQTPLAHTAITGADTVCTHGATILAHATGGVWTTTNSHATVVAGTVSGASTGIDTVICTATNSCGSLADSMIVKVQHCADGITPRVSPTGASMQVTPNPGNGTFSVLLSSPTSEACTITVRDAQGRTIHEATATTNTALPIHLHVPAGIYLLTAQTANARYEERIVVKK